MSDGFSFTGMFDQEELEDQVEGSEEAGDAADEVLANVLGYERKKSSVQPQKAQVSVRDKAIQQMEHANLYRVLLENKIFKPGSARAAIQDRVEIEIKEFIEEKLCELLNIGASKKKTATVLDGFSEKEMLALKILVSKIAQKLPDTTPTVPVVLKPGLNAVEAPKKTQPRKAELSQIEVEDGPVLNEVNENIESQESFEEVKPRPTKKVVKKSSSEDVEMQALRDRQKQISHGTQKTPPKAKRMRMPTVEEQMMKIQHDRQIMGDAATMTSVSSSNEPLDRERLSKTIGYNKE